MRGVAAALNGLGEVAAAQGDNESARRYHYQSLAKYREIDDRFPARPILETEIATHAFCGRFDERDSRPPAKLRVGMGTSLGALAMLHAHRHDPSGFAGLFLQSGSFFTETLDPQERRFPRFTEITDFVAQVHDTGVSGDAIPIGMTCGSAEENLACNRLMATRLAAHGQEVAFHLVPDAHNYTSWRDGFDPHLPALLNAALS